MKKTDYPDLERLPDTNFWKHLFWFWWNRPRIFVEDIYEKHVLQPKMDKEIAELNHIKKETELLMKIQLLEMALNEFKKRRN
jgi:hypothetical protein